MDAVVSLNLTTGTSAAVGPEVYDSPITIAGSIVIMEIVFWSAPYDLWIVLVREHTPRVWPPEAKVREVTLDEVEAMFPRV